jgi:hypothetical protein
VRVTDVRNERVYGAHLLGNKIGIYLMDLRVER